MTTCLGTKRICEPPLKFLLNLTLSTTAQAGPAFRISSDSQDSECKPHPTMLPFSYQYRKKSSFSGFAI